MPSIHKGTTAIILLTVLSLAPSVFCQLVWELSPQQKYCL